MEGSYSTLKSPSREKHALAAAVSQLCREHFSFKDDLTVEGLLGITIDNSTIVLINISEVVNKGDDSDCNLAKHIKNETCSVEEEEDIDLEMSVENTSLQDDDSSPENASRSHPKRRRKRDVVSNDSEKNQAKRKKWQIGTHVTLVDSMGDVEDESDVKTQPAKVSEGKTSELSQMREEYDGNAEQNEQPLIFQVLGSGEQKGHYRGVKRKPDADGKMTYTCHCGTVYKSRGALYQHIKSKHKGDYFVCGKCHKQFPHSQMVKDHYISAHGEGFKCDQPNCGKKFLNRCTLQRHIREKHTGVKLQCKLCDKEFSNSSQLQEHRRLAHTGKTYDCPVCGKIFIHRAGRTYCMTKHKKRGEQESDGVQDTGVTLPNQDICENTKGQSGSTNVQAS